MANGSRLKPNNSPLQSGEIARGVGANRANGRTEHQLSDDIFCKSLKSLTIGLDDGDSYMTSFAGVDVPDDAGFACMYPIDDLASSTVPRFGRWFDFHFHYSIAF